MTLAQAASASSCGPYDAITAQLSERYGEAPAFIGLPAEGGVPIEVWASSETESWSVLTLHPGGTACLKAHGVGFDLIAPTAPAEGSAL